MERLKPPITVVKCNLSKIARNPDTVRQLSKVAWNVSELTRLTYCFMKQFSLNQYRKEGTLPFDIMDKEFIMDSARTVCNLEKQGNNTKNNMERKARMKEFYDKDFRKLVEAEGFPTWEYMTQVMDYEAVSMLTNYSNNIVGNYENYVSRFVNALYMKEPRLSHWKQQKKEECELVRQAFEYEKGMLLWRKKARESIGTTQSKRKVLSKEYEEDIAELKKKMKQELAEICARYEKERKEYFAELKAAKTTILKKKVDDIPTILRPHYEFIMPQHEFAKPKDAKEDILQYDLKANTMKYWPCMVYMMDAIRKLPSWSVIYKKGGRRRTVTVREKLLNVFPTRTCQKAQHFKLDTAELIRLFYKKENQGDTGVQVMMEDIEFYKGAMWDMIFRTGKSCFKKKGYTFNHSIVTDGISCSLVFLRDDLYEQERKQQQRKRDKKKKQTGHSQKEEEQEKNFVLKFKVKAEQEKYQATLKVPYIDELDPAQKQKLQGKTVVGGDIGKNTLVHFTSRQTDESKTTERLKKSITTFRYTNNQRKKESKEREFKKKLERKKKNALCENQQMTVKEMEATLSNFNHKSLDMEEFAAYLKQKSFVVSQVKAFYHEEPIQKMNWFAQINRWRSEDRMVERFKATYGAPQQVVICLGDGGQGPQMKYKEPTIGKGLIKVFRRNGFHNVYYCDEFRTSKMDSVGGEETEKFLHTLNTKKWKLDKEIHYILRHSLLKSKVCNRIWNRDVNGSHNICHIAVCAINNLPRPPHLCRPPKKAENNSRKRCREESVEESQEPNPKRQCSDTSMDTAAE